MGAARHMLPDAPRLYALHFILHPAPALGSRRCGPIVLKLEIRISPPARGVEVICRPPDRAARQHDRGSHRHACTAKSAKRGCGTWRRHRANRRLDAGGGVEGGGGGRSATARHSVTALHSALGRFTRHSALGTRRFTRHSGASRGTRHSALGTRRFTRHSAASFDNAGQRRV